MAVCLSVCERGVIERLVVVGCSLVGIARVLGRSVSTVSREVSRNGGRCCYDSAVAERRAVRLRKRPKELKLLQFPMLAEQVSGLLKFQRMSPPTIAEYLRQAGCGVRVCAETIYQACYGSALAENGLGVVVQRRKSGLPGNSCDLLPRPKKRRKRRGTPGRANNLGAEFRHVSQRENLDSFGHWEGDLIAGANNKTFVATLIERKSRLTVLGEIKSRNSADFADRIVELINSLPTGAVQTITWDQGIEARKWREIEARTETRFYFASPRSPWQRPLNEQNNSILRKWFPKGTNIHKPQHELDQISETLNNHPRKSLNWKTPNQIFNTYTKNCVHP